MTGFVPESERNKNYKAGRDVTKAPVLFILFFILMVIWLLTPPGNKIAQVCLYGTKVQHFITQLTNPESVSEWIYHRNSAIYFGKMKYKKEALVEMKKAIDSYPVEAEEKGLDQLYRDSAILNLYFGEYKAALSDYMMVHSELDIYDTLRIALLWKLNGDNKRALTYCNMIFNMGNYTYAGYACIAEVYAEAGQPDAAVRVYDILIDSVGKRAKYYAERAKYKKMCGLNESAEEDIKKAKELMPYIDLDASIINDVMKPKHLMLNTIPQKRH